MLYIPHHDWHGQTQVFHTRTSAPAGLASPHLSPSHTWDHWTLDSGAAARPCISHCDYTRREEIT